MRIGHYAPNIWAPGGIATYIRRLGYAQQAGGHEVYYLGRTAGNDPEAPPTLEVEDDEDLFRRARGLGLDVLHLHKPVDVLPADRCVTVRTLHGNQASCPAGTRFLLRSAQPCGRAYSLAGCAWGHVVDRCGSLNPTKLKRHFGRIRQEMRLADAVYTFTVSRFLRDQMERSGCPVEKVHVLPSPAPDVAEAYAPPPRTGVPRFLFLGRLVPQKGIRWLLRAVRRVHPDIHLDVAGDGYIDREAKAEAERLGLSARVTFHGWVAPEAVTDLIRGARAVVVPSLWHEPAGLVTLEAAAYGRAVVASRVGGIPEYALESFATVVPPNDDAGLAAALTRLAGDWELATDMGRKGLEAAATRFSMEAFVQRQHALYALAIDARPDPVSIAT